MGSRVTVVAKIVHVDNTIAQSHMRASVCTINILDGSVDPAEGVNKYDFKYILQLRNSYFLQHWSRSQGDSIVISHVVEDLGCRIRH